MTYLALRKVKRQACLANTLACLRNFWPTIGRAIGTVCRLSSVAFSIAAKR